jgi:hypothetical protein
MNAVLSKMAKGITVCYSEVFPTQDNDYFHFAYIGKLFLIADSYCMNPDCTCQEAVLNFVQVYPREGKKAANFMIGLKLNGRGYKIHDYGKFNKREIKSIVMHFTSDDTILKLLNERFKEMKEKAKEILS